MSRFRRMRARLIKIKGQEVPPPEVFASKIRNECTTTPCFSSTQVPIATNP